MKRIVAVILISPFVAPPALADQKPGKPITWEKAQQLKVGTEVGSPSQAARPRRSSCSSRTT